MRLDRDKGSRACRWVGIRVLRCVLRVKAVGFRGARSLLRGGVGSRIYIGYTRVMVSLLPVTRALLAESAHADLEDGIHGVRGQ